MIHLFYSIYCVFSSLLHRKVKMVDIVTQTMPAESEVHVARNFLTKILRSSMRYRAAVGLCLVTPALRDPVVITHQLSVPGRPSITSFAMCCLSCSCAVHVQDGDYTLKLIIVCHFHWLL